MTRRWSIGIVGAGRSRNGLGPFLSRACELHGLSVTGIAGSNLARTAMVAASMATEFGHAVVAHADTAALVGSGIDALVIASPVEQHASALRLALHARLPVLCEKPLVAPGDFLASQEIIEGFAQCKILLFENCQWPFVLPAFFALYPNVRPALVQRIAMRLSPGEPGPAMVQDSLSHLLSVLQAVLPDSCEPQLISAVLLDGADVEAERFLRVELAAAGRQLVLELHLRCCVTQPRPAWLSLDGDRMDRQIGPGYAITFTAGERSIPCEDPLPLCVAAFARALKSDTLELRETALHAVRVRSHLYRAIMDLVGFH
ncbi:MAG: Gfo/Idh/MocA family oxidoreductase [Planctomycetota bacterium]|nr:Gfo/Idh/MocA family oxidoreductase [Planctomycetota bacterium]